MKVEKLKLSKIKLNPSNPRLIKDDINVNNNEVRLAIFGSRSLCDYRVDDLIQEKIIELRPKCIITSGETSGVNEIARIKARENKITLILEYANREKYAAGMYEHRCIEILKQCNYILFIHDGKSKGTKNEIIIAKKMGIKFEYHKMDLNNDYDLNLPELKFDW